MLNESVGVDGNSEPKVFLNYTVLVVHINVYYPWPEET